MAATVIAEHVDAHPVGDRVADGRLRRLLAVPYVCDERVRERWRDVDLGPSLARQRDVADDLLAARAGDARRRIISSRPAAVVLTTLPLVWSAELAARAVAAGCAVRARPSPRVSAELAPAALRVELRARRGAAATTSLARGRRRSCSTCCRTRRIRRCGSPCSAR